MHSGGQSLLWAAGIVAMVVVAVLAPEPALPVHGVRWLLYVVLALPSGALTWLAFGYSLASSIFWTGRRHDWSRSRAALIMMATGALVSARLASHYPLTQVAINPIVPVVVSRAVRSIGRVRSVTLSFADRRPEPLAGRSVEIDDRGTVRPLWFNLLLVVGLLGGALANATQGLPVTHYGASTMPPFVLPVLLYLGSLTVAIKHATRRWSPASDRI